MRKSIKGWKERICALLLAAVMVITGLMPGAATVQAAPGDGGTGEPTTEETVDVTFKVKDSANEETLLREDIKITVKEGGRIVGVATEAKRDGTYEVSELKADTEYTYAVEKSGYEYAEDSLERKFTPKELQEKTVVEVTMKMSEIELSTGNDPVSLTVGEQATIMVKNPVKEATYTWSVTQGSEYISVDDGMITAKAGGDAEDDSIKTATVKVSNVTKSKDITVTVSKKDLTDLKLQIDPKGSDSNNNNIKSITCTLSGFPDDATGTVNFSIGALNRSSSTVNIVNKEAEWTCTLEDGASFNGQYTVTAAYSGDTKYKSKTVHETTDTYMEEVSLEIEGENKKEVTFGDENWNKSFSFPLKEESVKGRTITYSVSGNEKEVIELDKTTGQITPKHAGTVTVKATAARQNNYIESSVEYTVTVKAKEIKPTEITWEENVSRVYNGETGIQIKGKVTDDQSYSVTVEGILTSADANVDGEETKEYTVQAKSYGVSNENGNTDYTLSGTEEEWKTAVETNVEITKRPVYVEIKKVAGKTQVIEEQYGVTYEKMQENVEAKSNLVGLAGENGKIDGKDDSGYLSEDKYTTLPNATFDSAKGFVTHEKNVGDVIEDIIIPDLSTGETGSNYKFAFDEKGQRGALKIIAQKLSDTQILEYITVSESGTGIDVRKDENGNIKEIWVSKEATLKLSVKQGYSDYYNTVKVEVDEVGIDATTKGITFDSFESGKQNSPLKAEIWLEKSDTVTRTESVNATEENKNNDFSNIVKVDSQSPKVTFEGLSDAGVVRQMTGAITFGVFDNKTYVESIKVLDADDLKEENEDTGSGLVTKESYVWKLGTETEPTSANIEKKAREINAEDWNSIGDDNKIVIGEGETKEEVENNYVVFVKTTDKVGNTDIYVSNGMVIEQNRPAISLKMKEDKDYYQDDVAYTLTVTDDIDENNNEHDYKSALASIEVTVKCDGEKVDGKEGTYENSYTIDLKKKTEEDKDNDAGYTIGELKSEQYNRKEINGVITANSNNVSIEIKAVDNAGNESTCIKELKIDKTKPEITVSYEDKVSPKNERYFKEDRIMKIQYKERNIEEDLIRFDVTKDGTEYMDCTLSELADLGIEWIDKKIVDSQEDITDDKQYTDKRTWDLSLRFGTDGDYTIIPKITDKAGNTNDSVTYADKNSEVNESFVIDKTAPVIDVAYTTGGNAFEPKNELLSDGQRAYSTKAVTAAVTIEEKNFWIEDKENKSFASDQFVFDGTQGVDSKNAAIGIEDYSAIANDASDTNWGTIGNQRTNSNFVFETDANYTFKFTYTDLAGNTAVYDSKYFTVDKPETDSPEGAISLDGEIGSIWSKIWNVITFNIFRDSSYEVTLDGTDRISGVASVEYYKAHDPISQNADMEGLAWKDLETSGEKAAVSGDFKVSPDEQFVVYEKITDYAGNVTYIYPTRGAVADETEPKITITEVNKNAARNGIYGKGDDVRLHIEVEDPVNGDTYSGIEKITYDVYSTGNVTNELRDQVLADNSKNRVQGHRTWSGDITIDKEQFNSNDVRVEVHATDFSGNTYSEEVQLKIDVKEPEISVTYDLNSPLNERYYNATRTATVTVTERNFDESAVRFNITNTDGTQPSVSGWTHSSDSGVSDKATHTCKVTFAADGDYTFTLNTTDLAGNDSNYTKVDDFTIDQTDPTIQVSYDNNNDAEPGYFNADRTATITVTEHNFNAADVNAAITASLEGRGVSTPGVGGWSTRGDVHTASVTFSADADYTFDVDYTDLAGNAAADYERDSFTIDQTAPKIEFFDIEDKSANNDVVAPGVRYSDNNYTENGVEITLEGANHGKMELDGNRSSIPNGESIKMADFERKKENDDLYTMTAVITDRAGNKTEDSVVFSVNRFGSVFVLSDDTQELVDDYYTNEEQDLVVTEINVDSLVFNGISYGRDGELVNLEAGKDYRVKASGSEASWKQYDYTINKENFEKEGNYTVTIDSEDRATNVGNSRAKGIDIEFAIDKTAPTIVITGVENDAQYRANTRDIVVNAADNIAMGEVEVYAGENPEPQTFDADEIRAEGGELAYTLDSSDSRQDIRAVATDAAGNTAEAEITRVLLTSNLFVQFYSNTPLLVGTIIGVAVIAGGLLWFFLIFKKKKDKEEQAN